MSLIAHAEKELKVAGLFDKDSDYNGALGDSALELIKVFANQGHSGMSASIVRNLFHKLADYKPLIPLTLKDDEWVEVGEDKFQNNRNSAVFKDSKDGRAYYIDAFVKIAHFPDGHKSGWSGRLELEGNKYISRCYIKDTSKMPNIKIELKAHHNSKDPADWEFELAKESQLEELRKHYDFEIEEQTND